ncbi:tyrosine-type recombinase/integrase [Rhizobium leguminosarum bv. viciae]|uniref:site-specific integrase n=1 Tax=Rhizobium ruizarguesonis TaxID=2081791 RepID=UPI00143F408F|nr:site-specific integrase [Rhizobium ruizarguesonis]NKJ73391.1 tyrosine-type recombinase/integrase [Rhizobium leguminosarum bv. viciae]NKQ78651.1 integrase [Rhizobium ruizarguesonis]
MSRRKKEPHLILRRTRYDGTGRVTHWATWIIKDGARQTPTGCGRDDFAAAELRLHEYNVEKHAAVQLGEGRPAGKVVIGDLIAFYLRRNATAIEKMRPDRRRARLQELRRLNQFWGGRYVSEINEETSLEYQKGRTVSTVRNELTALRAIVNLGELKGKLDKGGRRLDYMIPRKPKARVAFYSRLEIARLVWTAYRAGNSSSRFKDHRKTVHIARFILVGVYTGTRSDRIERASFVREEGRPWIDLDHGIFYRRADGEMTPGNKRADPVRIPLPLLRHMERWHRGRPGEKGARYLVEYRGRPASPQRGFYTLKSKIFDETRRAEVNRHVLRHTCATWLMQAGVRISLVANYLSTTEKIIEEVYGHHHPDFQSEADHAFSRGKAGRTGSGRFPRDPKRPKHPNPGAGGGDEEDGPWPD